MFDLAKLIWMKIQPEKPFSVIFDKPFEHDVQKRIQSVKKAKRILGFEATTTLDVMLDEVIPWIQEAVALDLI